MQESIIVEERPIDVLMNVIFANDIRAFDIALSYIEDVNEIDKNGDYAIASATWVSNALMIQRLLKRNADPNVRARSRTRRNGQTPLLMSIPARKELSMLLLNGGADTNMADNYGQTPLMKAMRTIDPIDEALIAAGADFNVRNQDGKTILIMSIENNRTRVFNKIVSKMKDINALDKTGKFTALDYAEILQKTDMVFLLKKYGGKRASELS